VLSNVNILIPAKQTIAIVGESGSGKSTLISLITRLNQCFEGHIYIDEHFLLSSIKSYRQQIALVHQEPSLIVASIKDNIKPTSNLDLTTERLLMDSLKGFMATRTTIIVAHRLSSITFADKIIVLKNGMIEEEGTHEQLLLNNRLYSQLWKNNES